jgi:hypothetical protein
MRFKILLSINKIAWFGVVYVLNPGVNYLILIEYLHLTGVWLGVYLGIIATK